jgi:hypothetical protein
MNRLNAWLMDKLAGALEPGEREAVLGDLAEANEPSAQALRDLAGLVARRQLTLWKQWQPWLVLIAIVIPLGFMLGIHRRSMANLSLVFLWRYVSLGTFQLSDLSDWQFSMNLAATVGRSLWIWISGCCAAWAAGFAVATLARRTRMISLPVWAMFVLLGTAVIGRPAEVLRAPASFAIPALLITYLTLFPAILGSRHASHRVPLSERRQAFLLAFIVAQVLWPIMVLPLTVRVSGLALRMILGVSLFAGYLNYWPIAYWIYRKWHAIRNNKSITVQGAEGI